MCFLLGKNKLFWEEGYKLRVNLSIICGINILVQCIWYAGYAAVCGTQAIYAKDLEPELIFRRKSSVKESIMLKSERLCHICLIYLGWGVSGASKTQSILLQNRIPFTKT